VRRSRAKVVVLGCTALVSLVSVSKPAEQRSFGAHLEGGFGQSSSRPLEVERVAGATASAGWSMSAVGALRVALELSATAGGEFGTGTVSIPEASRPGDRSLTTLLLGAEVAHRHTAHGPFAFVGAGAGRSSLKNARGVFEPPYGDNWLIPARSLTALAFGIGAGYRFGAGPGPLGFQLALRSHALLDAGQIPASAYALTVGLAY